MAQVQGSAHAPGFYCASGKKIPLTASSQFMAVRPSATQRADAARQQRLASTLTTVVAPNQLFELPDYGIKIIRVPRGTAPGGQAPLEQVRSFVANQPDVESGPPVYEVPDAATQDQALVAVGEILVKFRPDVSEALTSHDPSWSSEIDETCRSARVKGAP